MKEMLNEMNTSGKGCEGKRETYEKDRQEEIRHRNTNRS